MNNIDNAINGFKNGQIGIFPTDTAFGIGCRVDAIDSINRIYEIRNRPMEKALIVLVDSVEMAKKYVEINKEISEKLIDPYWPGGLTIICKCKIEKIPSVVRAGSNTLAIRMPDHDEIRKIIREVGVPIVAPSANFAGDKTPFTIADIDKNLIKKVDFVLEGVCTMGGVSTIINTVSSPWKILRQGVVSLDIY